MLPKDTEGIVLLSYLSSHKDKANYYNCEKLDIYTRQQLSQGPSPLKLRIRYNQ